MALLLVVEPFLLQACAHPRLQQHGVEGLAEVIVGAELDAPHHAVHLVQRGDHEHGDVAPRGIALDPLEHGIAVQVRHHDVEEDEVDGRPREHVEARLPPRGGEHLVALTAEAPGQHVAVLLAVVHHQDDAAARRRRGRGLGLRARRPTRGRHAAVAGAARGGARRPRGFDRGRAPVRRRRPRRPAGGARPPRRGRARGAG